MSASPQVHLPVDTTRDKAVAVVLWVLGLAWLVPNAVMLYLLAKTVGADRSDAFSRLYCRVQVALTGCRWRAQVHPAVDPNRPCIYVQNHVNVLDACVLYPATRHFKQGVNLEKHFRVPFYGWFMKARGTIGVRPGQGQFDALREAVRREASLGHAVLVFPEGHRTLTGRMGPFKKGFFTIARDLRLPVVPVVVTGWYETLRKGSWVFRPGHTVTVHVLEPIVVADLTDEQVQVAVARCRQAMVAIEDVYWSARTSQGSLA